MRVALIGMLLSGVFVVAAIASPLRAQDADIAGLMNELSQLRAEQNQIIAKMQQNLLLKTKYEQQLAQLAVEATALKTEWDGIEVQRGQVRKICTAKVTKDKLAAAKKRCDSVLRPFNQRVAAFNTRKKNLDTNQQTVRQLEAARASAAAPVEARNDQINRRVAYLEASIRAHGGTITGSLSRGQAGSRDTPTDTSQPTPRQIIDAHFRLARKPN